MGAIKRKPLSKRLRFEIFKRDGFVCIYCGASPAQKMLRVDHVVPVARGGEDDASNLVTSCFDCNAGKSDVPLEHPALKTGDAEASRERAEQLRGYLEAERERMDAQDSIVDELCEVWTMTTRGQLWPQARSVLYDFISDIPFDSLVWAIRRAAVKFPKGSGGQPTARFRYFCGIVRNWRRRGAVER